VEIEGELLGVEQLPQLARVTGTVLSWRRSLTLIGPDGSAVRVLGQGEPMNALAPLQEIQIPWTFPKLDYDSLVSMARDLIPCGEGRGFLNPSPWERAAILDGKEVTLGPGEMGGDAEIGEERGVSSIKLYTGFYNVHLHHLNPLYIQDLGQASSIKLKSYLTSLQNTFGITVVSRSPFDLEFEDGELKVQGGDLKLIKSNDWKEAKPHRLAWDSINEVLTMDCQPKYRVSLLKIEPSSVLPVYIRYEDFKAELGLLNLNDRPVISTLYLPARITSAKVRNFDEGKWENLESEFDRVRIPITKWGLSLVYIELRRLLEQLLKKKIISK